MPTHMIDKPGNYHVWAVAQGRQTTVTITVTAPDGAEIATAYWSTTPPTLPGMPDDGRATAAEIHAVPAGATVHTRPDEARLIVRRPGDLNPVYDSGEPDDAAPRRTLPKPRTSTDTTP